MGERTTTILVVDDHPLLLAGLCMLLNAEDDLTVVGQADRAENALSLAADLQPAVVLLDINLHDISGIDLIPRLLEVAPAALVIILTMYEDQGYLQKAMRAGAQGFVLKKGLDVDLLYAIRAVRRGEVYVHPSMLRDFVSGGSGESADHETQLWDSLSRREQQVMLAVAKGHIGREIAEQYFLSDKTVATYRARAMTKLGLATKAELMELVLRLGKLKVKVL